MRDDKVVPPASVDVHASERHRLLVARHHHGALVGVDEQRDAAVAAVPRARLSGVDVQHHQPQPDVERLYAQPGGH